jgi:hypothetical protein
MFILVGSEEWFMYDRCCYCKKEVKGKDKFVLIGRYPGSIRRSIFGSLLIFGLGTLGNMYHKDCFYKKIISSNIKTNGAKLEVE